MGKIIETIRNLFPLIQPEWIVCRSKDIPPEVMASFVEEEEYLKRIGKKNIDFKLRGYRYILTPKKETFMYRRKVSLI